MVLPNTAGNPLAAGSLATFMASSLPKGEASPPLKNAYDVIALAAHAGMIAVGFRLIGLGEDHKIEAQADAHDPQPLPREWNVSSSYAFRYAHAQSSMEYLIKVNSLGPKAIVFGLAVGDDKTAQFEVKVEDYVSKSNLSSARINSETLIEDVRKILQDIFISAGRLNDFGSLLKISIIQKLAPSINKEGYEETPREVDEPEPSNRGRPNPPRAPAELPEPARPHPFHDPLAMPPFGGNRPLPEPIPGFEDEFEINRPPRGIHAPGRSPFGYGEQDLYPPGLGPHDPIRPHFGGGGGGSLRQPGTGGMHPTFNDPLFGGAGVGGYDPHAPPGARYDPVGPGDGPRDRQTGPRFPGGGGLGGRPSNPFSGFGHGDFI